MSVRDGVTPVERIAAEVRMAKALDDAHEHLIQATKHGDQAQTAAAMAALHSARLALTMIDDAQIALGGDE